MDVIVLPYRVHAFIAHDVQRLYATQGWWPQRTAERIDTILRSQPAVGAWRDDRLVGFARAVSDGCFRAYVEDVVVEPGAQGQGIGRRLVDTLTAELAEIEVTSLFCSPDHVRWYADAGFSFTGQRVGHLRAP